MHLPVIEGYPCSPPVGPIWAKNTPSSGSWHCIGGITQGCAAFLAGFGVGRRLPRRPPFFFFFPAMGQFHCGRRPKSSFRSRGILFA